MIVRPIHIALSLLAMILVAGVLVWSLDTKLDRQDASSGSGVDEPDTSHLSNDKTRFLAARFVVGKVSESDLPRFSERDLLARVYWNTLDGAGIEDYALKPTNVTEGEVQYMLRATVPSYVVVAGLFVSDPRVCPFGTALKSSGSKEEAEGLASAHALTPMQTLRFNGKTVSGGQVDDFRVRASIKGSFGEGTLAKTIRLLGNTLEKVPASSSADKARLELEQVRAFLSSLADGVLFLSEKGTATIAIPARAVVSGLAISSGFQATSIDALVMPECEHEQDVTFEEGVTISAHIQGVDGKAKEGARVRCHVATETLIAETDSRGIAVLPVGTRGETYSTCDVSARWGNESALRKGVSLTKSQVVRLRLRAPTKFYGLVRDSASSEALAGVKLRVRSMTPNLFAGQAVSGLDGRVEFEVPEAIEGIFFWVVGRYGPRQAYRPGQYFENESLNKIKNRMYSKSEFGSEQSPQKIELALDKDVNTTDTGSLKVTWQTRRGQKDSIQIIAWYAPWNEDLQAFTPEQPVDFMLNSSDPRVMLPAGKYRIEGTTDPSSGKRQRSPYQEVVVLPNNETTINLMLEPLGNRRLLLLDDQGKPLPDTTFFLDGMPRNGISAKTDASGFASLHQVPLGKHTISLAHSAFWSNSTNDLPIRFDAKGQKPVEVRCVLAAPQIIVLFDQDIEPPSSLTLTHIDSGSGFPQPPFTSESDRAEYFGLGYGKWYLRATGPAGEKLAHTAHITISDFHTQHIYRWMGRGIGPNKGFQRVE